MVSLPKDWVKANNLEQGDELFLIVDKGYVRIQPKKILDEEKVVKAYVGRIPRHDEKFLTRYVYALYIQGLDEIVIEDRTMSAKVLSRLSDIVRTMIGVEIIDASPRRVVIRCMTSPDLDVKGVLKRMAQIISGMIEGIEDSIRLGDKDGLKEVAQLESDTDRLYLLAVRLENRLVREYSSPARWNELRYMLGVRMVAKLFEEIADSMYDFAGYAEHLIESKETDLLKYLGEVYDTFNKVFKAYMEGDVELSEDVIRMVEDLEEELLKAMGENDDVHYRLALECLLDATRDIKSIGEVAFNKSVREHLSANANQKV